MQLQYGDLAAVRQNRDAFNLIAAETELGQREPFQRRKIGYLLVKQHKFREVCHVRNILKRADRSYACNLLAVEIVACA